MQSLGYLTVLDDKAVVDARLEHLQHLRVLHVVANVLQDVAVGDDAEPSEHNPDGDVDLDVRDGRLDDVADLPCE
jgi:hypothetical protein